MEHPRIVVGTPREYAYWIARLRRFLAERGASADDLEQLDARINYKGNRITLYRLSNPAEDGSVAETISHEVLHALFYQMGEYRAAREIDLVAKPARSTERIGGI
ncbi:MAG: hypothetical protein L3K10_00470 [Thermoplasmata archaeon]|nr:hypothetical protein [Thermoplasmata archaeon]